ncbi:MAG: zf-HC2 domain-containing protein [Anaerolineae bacterium]|nr:MAG: zf-HC2 domain-containing protein [Anaerolineae bacterium]
MLDFVRRGIRSKHEQITAVLSAYIDGEVTGKDRQRVEAHLADCDACAEALRALQYTKALVIEAPTPRIPRSFVVRRADLEGPAEAATRRRSALGSKLAYAYLRGATAVVAVAFALLVAGDLMGQLGLGSQAPAQAPLREAGVAEQEKVVEVTKEVEALEAPIVVQETVKETVAVEGTPRAVEKEVTQVVEAEKVVEKEVELAPTPSPAVREALPTASPRPAEVEQESVQPLAVPEAPSLESADATGPPTAEATAEEAYGAAETLTPAPVPTATPPPPTPLPPGLTSTAPATPVVVTVRPPVRRGLIAVRVAEIGLGVLALALLVVTLVARRQQP